MNKEKPMAEELRKLLSVFNPDKLVSKEDIATTLDGVAKLLSHFKETSEEMTDEMKTRVDGAISDCKSLCDEMESKMETMDKKCMSEMDKKMAEIKALASEVMAMKPVDGRDGKDGLDGRDGKDGKDGVNGSPDTAEEIKGKLESLKGEERLDAFAIKNLPQMAQQIFRASPGVNKIKAGSGVTITDTQGGTGQGEVTISATGSGNGDVVGPASAIDSNFASFNTTTGKLIKDSGSKAADFATAGHNHTGVYAPVLGADDNYVTDAEKTKLSNLSGTNTGDQIISDATLSTSDITTNNFTTLKHGFVPKGTNVGNFLKDDGTWGAPSGGGDMLLASAQTNSGAKTFLDATMLLRNVANTFSGKFTNAITAARTWTLKDADGTIAFTSDITGTNSGTNTGDQTITLTSDVTGSGTGSFATTIANGAVTLAKMADMATSSLIYRKTAGAGAPEVNTLATLKTDLGLTGTNSGDQDLSGYQLTSGKDATGGYAGLTLFKINFKNAANTFTNFLTNATTAARTWTFPDKDGTVAMTSDITGTNSGTNTGDQTISIGGDVTAAGSTGALTATVTKINGTALSGLATGVLKNTTTTGVPFISKVALTEPATAATLTIADNQTLTVNGSATITNGTHSGTNTGDQTTVSGNAGTATTLQTARNINGVSFNGSADITVPAAAGTLTGATLASGVTASSLTSLGTVADLRATLLGVAGATPTTLNPFYVNTPDSGAFVLNGPSGVVNSAAMKWMSGGVEKAAFTYNDTGSALRMYTIGGDIGIYADNTTGRGLTIATSTGNITMNGSLGVTGTRVSKGWFAALESTAMPTVGGTAILSSLTAPQFTTLELGHATDTTLSRSAAGVLAVEGVDLLKVNANASDAETTTGTSTTKFVTPDGLAGSSIFGRKTVSIQVTDGATDVATGDGKAYLTIPEALNGMNLVRAQATVVTAGTTNATTVMIHNKTDAADMLSGAISIASAGTVGTVGTVNGATDDVATNDVLRIDVDSVSTTAPKGLMVVLEFQLP